MSDTHPHPASPTATRGLSEDRATSRRRIILLGAAGRDFHNFNIVYRDDPAVEVVAFTAAQIPGIAGRRYPASLAGSLYPDGIPIVDEAALEVVCRPGEIECIVFSYSDVSHEHVMHLASRSLALGADFILLGPKRTMLISSLPVIAVTAVRTGCGKSQIARWVSRRLRERGKRVAIIRHPMPYGDLASARVQRFASLSDLDTARCTAEEREEYEPHIAQGFVVFAGLDYAEILHAAETEADIIVWDGGNNDFPFVRPDLHITVADALRPHQIKTHHPGETVARMADVLVINKVDAARAIDVQAAKEELRSVNSVAPIVLGASPVHLDDMAAVRGRRVLVIEDGPTLTHGGMAHGAGYVAARAAGAAVLVDPRSTASPAIRALYDAYPHIGPVLPAVGYSAEQLWAVEETVNNTDADVVISATPFDIARILHIAKPVIRARYEFAETGDLKLSAILDEFLNRIATTTAS